MTLSEEIKWSVGYDTECNEITRIFYEKAAKEGLIEKRNATANHKELTGKTFIVPMQNNTGSLETNWNKGGMTHPVRTAFGLSKKEWNEKVLRPLEEWIPERYSGKALFHFHDGHILKVEVLYK
jgi:hypothetical protein